MNDVLMTVLQVTGGDTTASDILWIAMMCGSLVIVLAMAGQF